MQQRVLVTGITGFLGSHTAIQLLEKGYQVVGTMRNLQRAPQIKSVIAQHTTNISALSFAEAELTDAEVWTSITKGIDYIVHIASPFPRELPKNEEELIVPAKQGVLNVLKAATKNGVKRVVVTSSSGAIVYGKSKTSRVGTFTEEDWTDVEDIKDTTPYFRSKTIAERAAWDFIKQDASGMELATICPGAILGPVLEQDFGTSANIVKKCLDGSAPAVPPIGFDVVDVRSVADLHVRAMESPKAAGERFIGSAGFLRFAEVAGILREAYPHRKIPSFVLPGFFMRIFALFDKTVGPILVDIGAERRVDHSKARQLLGWEPINNKEAVLACARSMMKLNIV